MADILIAETVSYLDNVATRFTLSAAGAVEGNALPQPVPGNQYLYVDRIVLRANPTTITWTEFVLYANSSDPTNIREWINVGPTNVAVESTPVVFAPAEIPFARWSGVSAAATVTVILTGRYIQRLNRQVPDIDRQPVYDEQLADLAAASNPTDLGRFDDPPARIVKRNTLLGR